MSLFGSIIGGLGSVVGGAISAKGADKAAKLQLQGVQQQIAATNANRDYQYDLNAPTIAATSGAAPAIAGLLGVGGDPAAATAARDQFRASSGYQDLLDTGLKAVNSNAYAKGMGNSGAAYKALVGKATNIADSSQQGYLNNLISLSNIGGQARGLVAGVGTNAVNSNNAATQTGADARSNSALLQSSGWTQALQGLANAGANYFGSSYGGSSGGGIPGWPTGVPQPSFDDSLLGRGGVFGNPSTRY